MGNFHSSTDIRVLKNSITDALAKIKCNYFQGICSIHSYIFYTEHSYCKSILNIMVVIEGHITH